MNEHLAVSEQGQSVLVVDDNEANRDLLARRVSRRGYDVVTANGGAEALELIATRRFDIVLLDLMMPDINGLEVLERLRRDHSASKLPVIMVTAKSESGSVVEALKLGANDYVTKPVDFPVLYARMQAQLARKLAEEVLEEVNRTLEIRVAERTAELRAANDALADEIAERRRAEERESLVLESTAEAIYGVDLDGNCTFCNPACVDLIGVETPGDLLGTRMPGLPPAAWSDEAYAVCRAVRAGERAHSDNEVMHRADGESFPAEAWVRPMRQDGELVGAVVTFVDITERKLIDQRMRESQKLEAVGQLAGGIAHEFNNLLMIIGGYIEKALKASKDSERLQDDLGQASSAVRRATTLTKRLLVFSRKQPFENRVVGVPEALNGIDKLLHPLLGERFSLAVEIDDQGVFVELDPDQLTQAIVNLVINARDAMPAGGRVQIGSYVVGAGGQSPAPAGFDAALGPHAAIYVTDEGIGIDDETMRRIFEPFFTTKGVGAGTGLGLAMVHGFVERSNGLIDVRSKPGEGTTFTMYFPLTENRPALETELGDDVPRGNGEVVLVVEDEDALRDLLRDSLEDLGYTVLAARDGPDALEMEEDFEGEIGLLISDVVMPGFGGVDVARAVRQTRPSVKVILISGNTVHGNSKDVQLPDFATFLPKPVQQATLARKMRALLDGAARHAA